MATHRQICPRIPAHALPRKAPNAANAPCPESRHGQPRNRPTPRCTIPRSPRPHLIASGSPVGMTPTCAWPRHHALPRPHPRRLAAFPDVPVCAVACLHVYLPTLSRSLGFAATQLTRNPVSGLLAVVYPLQGSPFPGLRPAISTGTRQLRLNASTVTDFPRFARSSPMHALRPHTDFFLRAGVRSSKPMALVRCPRRAIISAKPQSRRSRRYVYGHGSIPGGLAHG